MGDVLMCQREPLGGRIKIFCSPLLYAIDYEATVALRHARSLDTRLSKASPTGVTAKRTRVAATESSQ